MCCLMNLDKILRAAKVTGVQAYNKAQQEEEADEEQGGRTYLDVDSECNCKINW